MNEITFTNVLNVPEEYTPKPASMVIPEWYKNIGSYISGDKKPIGDGTTTSTIKKCMPVFDAISGGYIVFSCADVFVSQKENPQGIKQPWYEWANYDLIQFHPIEQALEHPARNNDTAYPKWINPWAIKTPKGYSTLFVQPMHRESSFTILPGIVDTDTYTAPVNFPFILNDKNFEGLIPAGTPIAQIIPIKRDEWKMRVGNHQDLIEQQKVTNRLNAKFFDRYKTLFRQHKSYK